MTLFSETNLPQRERIPSFPIKSMATYEETGLGVKEKKRTIQSTFTT